MTIERVNEWGKANPVKGAVLTALILFVILFAFGVLILNQTPEIAAAFAGTYAIVFSVLTAAMKAYRSRRAKDRS